ncbi:unnamed protein product, partial [Mesorhabditis spiculigera]
MQVEAERRKRAAILESEGQRVAAINVAEGKKKAQVLASEAKELEQMNIARGQAQAIQVYAEARAAALERIAAAMEKNEGSGAASLTIAEQYVEAFSKLAKETNTIILPANIQEPSAMVAQAMAVYKSITSENRRAERLDPQKILDQSKNDN